MIQDDKNLSCEQIIAEFQSQCSRSCAKNGDCIKFIQLYLDNMACKNADKYFLDGTKNCKECTEYFKIHDWIKANLKAKNSAINVPSNLELLIKDGIK